MIHFSRVSQHKLEISAWVFLFAALVTATLISPTTSAQGATTILPNPLTLEVGLGQVSSLDIQIENVQNLYGVELQAHFDPTVVQVVDADSSQSGIQLVPGSFVKPDFLLYNVADNQQGILEYILTETNPTPPVSGTGTLVTIKFRGIVLAQDSPFVIDFVMFSDRHGQTIPVIPENGLINVVPHVTLSQYIYYFPVIGRDATLPNYIYYFPIIGRAP